MPPIVPNSTGTLMNRYGAGQAKKCVIYEGDAGSDETQKKAVEHRMVQPAARHGKALGIVVEP